MCVAAYRCDSHESEGCSLPCSKWSLCLSYQPHERRLTRSSPAPGLQCSCECGHTNSGHKLCTRSQHHQQWSHLFIICMVKVRRFAAAAKLLPRLASDSTAVIAASKSRFSLLPAVALAGAAVAAAAVAIVCVCAFVLWPCAARVGCRQHPHTTANHKHYHIHSQARREGLKQYQRIRLSGCKHASV